MASRASRNSAAKGALKRKSPAARSFAGEPVPTYHLEGSALKTLAELDLPHGTQIAIMPPTAQAAEALQKAGLVRSGRLRFPGRGVTRRAASPEVSDPSAFAPDARARALLRGVRIAHQDLQSAGGAFELDEVRELLGGISPQAVSKRVREGTLLAVPGPSNRRRYPTLQFRPDGSVVDGLREVQASLPSRNPWVMLNFLATPDVRLGEKRPVDLLKGGEVERVIASARRSGEQGA